MTAFNTATNTGSTTFTNSWGTISLLPSASPQYAYGFERNDGWRYFEVYIDNAGGDNGKLFAGYALTPSFPTAILFGGNSEQAYLGGGAITPHPYLAFPSSITAETGDVFMFAVDLTGYGRNHAGVPQLAATISSGTGTTLHPLFGEIGKNGTWLGGGLVGWEWASGGYPTRAYPVVARDSTSASDAVVSLRVATTSFAYAIPTGMIAWGDGPAGGSSTSADATIYWDAATKDSEISLTNSNFLATNTSAGSSLSVFSVKTTALVTTGKRVIEFWGNVRAYGTSLSAVSPGQDVHFNIGICTSDMTSISWAPGGTSTKIIWGTDKKRRGVDKSSSMTNVQSDLPFGPQGNGSIFYLDFDTERLWQRRGLNAGNTFYGKLWAGRTLSHSNGPNPYWGIDGMTFSVTSPGLRMIAWDRKDFYSSGGWIYVNAGQTPFQTFPLLPGWKSMDGGREVQGNMTMWDTTVMPASLSTCFSGLGVRHSRGTADNAFTRSNRAKSSGKLFFEIFCDLGNGGGSLSTVMGLIPPTVGTFTAVNVTSIVSTGFWWIPGGRDRIKNGTTISASNSATWTSGTILGATNAWYACAVDFDAGNIWFGYWNWNRQAIAWAVGADPATGTQPDMTFTASSTLYIAMTAGANWRYLITESANVIGMPSGFTPWDGTSTPVSATATPSGTTGSNKVLWPYGVMT